MRHAVRSRAIFFGVVTGCALLSCAPIGPGPSGAVGVASGGYGAMAAGQLWALQSSLKTPRDLSAVEVELALRGETRRGEAYLGKRTASAVGSTIYARASSQTNSRNCSDFSSAAAAQKAFVDSGGPVSDPYDLDRDGDGLACEWGATLQRIARQADGATTAAAAGPVFMAPRAPIARTCYVGPRGGTYTLTSTGRKNYSGC